MSEAVTNRIDQEFERFQAERAKLFRNGRPVYTEPIQSERLNQVMAQFDERMRFTLSNSVGQAQEARRKLKALDKDPLERLSADELERANKLATFVREDIERMPLPEMVSKVASMAEEPDRPTRYLWYRYAGQRAEDLANRSRSGGRLSGDEAQQLHAIDKHLEAVEKSLLPPDAAEERVKAENQISESQQLERYATKRRAELDGAHEKMMERLRASGQYAI